MLPAFLLTLLLHFIWIRIRARWWPRFDRVLDPEHDYGVIDIKIKKKWWWDRIYVQVRILDDDAKIWIYIDQPRRCPPRFAIGDSLCVKPGHGRLQLQRVKPDRDRKRKSVLTEAS